MPIFAVIYHYDDRTELRMETRPEHRAFLTGLYDTGILLAIGAWADDGAPGALLVGTAASAEELAAALDADPYRRVGVLAKREIREWGQFMSPWTANAN